MAKKLTIAVEDEVYEGLHKIVGRRRIRRFLNDLARPHVTRGELAQAYRNMAADEERGREAASLCPVALHFSTRRSASAAPHWLAGCGSADNVRALPTALRWPFHQASLDGTFGQLRPQQQQQTQPLAA